MATMAVDPSSSAAAGPTGGSSSSSSSSGSRPAPPGPLPMPSHNPLPLSASQEAQVRELHFERVRQQCQAEIKAFADCAIGRTFSVVFKCRDKNHAMNACLKSHATPEAFDAAREEWFARRAERAAERHQKALRKAEQEKLIRAWWGLENQDGSTPSGFEDIQAKRRRREAENMHKPERIGGFPAKDRPRFDDSAAEAPGEGKK